MSHVLAISWSTEPKRGSFQPQSVSSDASNQNYEYRYSEMLRVKTVKILSHKYEMYRGGIWVSKYDFEVV